MKCGGPFHRAQQGRHANGVDLLGPGAIGVDYRSGNRTPEVEGSIPFCSTNRLVTRFPQAQVSWHTPRLARGSVYGSPAGVRTPPFPLSGRHPPACDPHGYGHIPLPCRSVDPFGSSLRFAASFPAANPPQAHHSSCGSLHRHSRRPLMACRTRLHGESGAGQMMSASGSTSGSCTD